MLLYWTFFPGPGSNIGDHMELYSELAGHDGYRKQQSLKVGENKRMPTLEKGEPLGPVPLKCVVKHR